VQRTRIVRRRLFRGEREVVDEDVIATREYFPSGFRASVRQRARWITGIALQAWRQSAGRARRRSATACGAIARR
jgi:hypothetical protein